ncbi:MAG: protein phosphatase 2C domain-containing protein [Firmicutes bacterium]|nr:protein phosphatase 2C domain-containing protein [Bacillota bacterium]
MVRLYGASVVGTSHLSTETPCHDNHAYKILPNGLGFIACVSDGMGSASHAELGSLTASTFIVDFLEKYLDVKMTDEEIITLIKEGFIETNDQLHDVANQNEVNIKDLNATLLVFVSFHDRQFYGQVGDCAAIGKIGDSYEVIAKQQRGEYANATFSICNLESIENGIYEKCDKFYPMVSLMSDGIESISISAKDKTVSHLFYDPFFKVFSHENYNQEEVQKSLERFLASERINKKTDDDKTLLFIEVRDE